MDYSSRLNGEGEGLKMKLGLFGTKSQGGVSKYVQLLFGSN